MALKLLQPGLRPMGQFDLEDDDQNSVLGGEFGVLEALQSSTDATPLTLLCRTSSKLRLVT